MYKNLWYEYLISQLITLRSNFYYWVSYEENNFIIFIANNI